MTDREDKIRRAYQIFADSARVTSESVGPYVKGSMNQPTYGGKIKKRVKPRHLKALQEHDD